jgi:hypothetical protein
VGLHAGAGPLRARVSSRSSGGWPRPQAMRSARASCSTMSGACRSGPRPTVWRSMSAACVPSCAPRGLMAWSRLCPTAHTGCSR